MEGTDFNIMTATYPKYIANGRVRGANSEVKDEARGFTLTILIQ